MRATVRCSFAGIPEGATVEVIALAVSGGARSLVVYEGRPVRVTNEAFLQVAQAACNESGGEVWPR